MYYTDMEQHIIHQATYVKADGMAGERTLTYGTNAKGQYVVRIGLPVGEGIGIESSIFRYATIEEAGRKCGETLKAWEIAGYIPAEDYRDLIRQKAGGA